MKISRNGESGKLTVFMEGELDQHSAKTYISEIEILLDKYLPRDLCIDMRNMSFMDSSGIAIILKANRKMNMLGGKMCIENVQNQPLRVLDASGIDRLINVKTGREVTT